MSIKVKDVSYVYMPGTPFESKAIEGINLTIGKGEFWGIIGHTGSGKSTLIQHFNGLLRPTAGKVLVFGVDISDKKADLRRIRQKVGLIFQYPEHQIFEETVYKDIAFGPKNMGLPETTIEARVREALTMVGLDYDDVKDRSPFELSGGQMRRVAIAGVLAMKPEVIILDEPTAGLDPRGRDEILAQIDRFHKDLGLTVVLVSHSMEDIARLVDRIAVMHKGKIVLTGTPKEVFAQPDRLKAMGLGIPQVTELLFQLKYRGKPVRTDIFTINGAEKEILMKMRGKANA
jgi:energy-coupling factor transport system ATP-binding protein